MKISLIAIKAILISCVFGACKQPPKAQWDFEQIKQKKELTVITLNSSMSYFMYKDEPMGYDYDLSKDFCDHYGLKLKVKVAENANRLLEMLKNGEGDIVAYPVTIQNELKDSVIFCGPEQISHQVLVQRSNVGDTIINDVTQLIGKEVVVKHDSKYHQRLINLNSELGSDILIQDAAKDTVTIEDLIQMVSEGTIKYTVSDEYVARLNKTYFRNINISLPLSFEQKSSWVVRRDTPLLAEALNEWVKDKEYKRMYSNIIKRYFELSKMPFDGDYVIPQYLPKGNISVFDDVFKKHADGTIFDWQMLASIAYQESRFRTDVVSWAGAAGLMGLMPRTATSLGITVEDRKDPDLSVMASVKLLHKLNKMFSKIEDPEERIKFVLASYNGGNGHIFDAQALARKYGERDYVWADVEKYLTLKSNPEYYNDSVVKNGYFRATETTRYVDQVVSNWRKFKEKKL